MSGGNSGRLVGFGDDGGRHDQGILGFYQFLAASHRADPHLESQQRSLDDHPRR
jgi:hypothetical protein